MALAFCPEIPLMPSLLSWSTAELKTMQVVITLVVFAVFSVLDLRERFTLNHAVGFGLIAAGACFVFAGPFR